MTQNYAPGQVLTAAAVNAELAFPTGSMIPFAGASAPPQTISGVSAWLICDGAAVSRTTYAALFTTLSTTYGAGDGTTTFNLPDLRGRMPIGAGNENVTGNNTARVLGIKGGDTRLQAHEHTANKAGSAGGDGSGLAWSSTTLAADPIYGNGVQSSVPTGSGGNMPPFLVTNYIIKT